MSRLSNYHDRLQFWQMASEESRLQISILQWVVFAIIRHAV